MLAHKYKFAIQPLVRLLDKITSFGPVIIWKNSNPATTKGLAPNALKLWRWKVIPEWNQVAEDLVRSMNNEKFLIWNNTAVIAKEFDTAWNLGKVKNSLHTGIHYPPDAISPQVTLLLNFVCDSYLQSEKTIRYSDLTAGL